MNHLFQELYNQRYYAPFCVWFLNLMEGLTWMNAFLLMTWQKVAPLMLISYLNFSNLLFISVILLVIIGAVWGLTQTSLRKLMALSSINHLGWILSVLKIRESISLIYFMFYSFLSFVLVFMFKIFKCFYLTQLFLWFTQNKILKLTLFMPPFLEFFKMNCYSTINFLFKMFFINNFGNNKFNYFIFYLRFLFCFSAFMLNYFENNWFMNSYSNNFSMNLYLILTFLSIFGLFLISMFYFMF